MGLKIVHPCLGLLREEEEEGGGGGGGGEEEEEEVLFQSGQDHLGCAHIRVDKAAGLKSQSYCDISATVFKKISYPTSELF